MLSDTISSGQKNGRGHDESERSPHREEKALKTNTSDLGKGGRGRALGNVGGGGTSSSGLDNSASDDIKDQIKSAMALAEVGMVKTVTEGVSGMVVEICKGTVLSVTSGLWEKQDARMAKMEAAQAVQNQKIVSLTETVEQMSEKLDRFLNRSSSLPTLPSATASIQPGFVEQS